MSVSGRKTSVTETFEEIEGLLSVLQKKGESEAKPSPSDGQPKLVLAKKSSVNEEPPLKANPSSSGEVGVDYWRDRALIAEKKYADIELKVKKVVAQVKEERSKLRKENDDLKSRTTQAEKKLEDYERNMKDLVQKVNQERQQEGNSAALMKQRCSDAEKRIAALIEENDRLKRGLDDVKREKEDVTQEKKSLQKNMDQMSAPSPARELTSPTSRKTPPPFRSSRSSAILLVPKDGAPSNAPPLAFPLHHAKDDIDIASSGKRTSYRSLAASHFSADDLPAKKSTVFSPGDTRSLRPGHNNRRGSIYSSDEEDERKSSNELARPGTAELSRQNYYGTARVGKSQADKRKSRHSVGYYGDQPGKLTPLTPSLSTSSESSRNSEEGADLNMNSAVLFEGERMMLKELGWFLEVTPSEAEESIGFFCVSNFRIFFLSKRDELLSCLPLTCIVKIMKVKEKQVKGKLHFRVHTRTFSVHNFAVKKSPKDRGDFLKRVLGCFPKDPREMFAFKLKWDPQLENPKAENGWTIYDPVKDFERMNIPDNSWRFTHINANYQMCSSYPQLLVVPAESTDAELEKVSLFRSRGRIPVLVWRHPLTEAVLLRCSQPLVGLTRARSQEDETLIQQIASMNPWSKTVYILDSRPKVNAQANTVKGMGYELSQNYGNIQLEFSNVANIHVMRDSLRKLIKNGDVEGSGWVEHLRRILMSCIRIVDLLDSEKYSVLSHCSDGWDRTSQTTALAELLLDPHYRTLNGFCALIQKEFLSFGHKFALRGGYDTFFFSDEFKDKEISPIFPQFIDCVYQIVRQLPDYFEFNESLLTCIMDHMYSCLYGTFLFNSDQERRQEQVENQTVSLWTAVNYNKEIFLNQNYVPPTGSTRVLRPNVSSSNIVVWEYYARWKTPWNFTYRGLEYITPDFKFKRSSNLKVKEEEEKELATWRKLDRNGFLIEDPNVEEDPQKLEKEMKRAVKWHAMITDWNKYTKTKKIRLRCEKGIPPRVRAAAWKLLTRSTLSQLPERSEISYESLSTKETRFSPDIVKDINRTFPKNILLMQQGGQHALSNVLNALAAYHPETGYTQGMAFITAVFLMYMNEEDAFWMMTQIIREYGMHEVWMNGFPGLFKCCFVLEKLVENYLPKLSQHMKKHGVMMEQIWTKSYITLFAISLPFTLVLRLWDVLFYEGQQLIYCISLAIMKLAEEHLLTLEFEDIFQYFQSLGTSKDKSGPLQDEELVFTTSLMLREKVKKSVDTVEKEYVKRRGSNAK
eukprot:TRINITY_DN8649_c0_g1_i1.p1 TRINITY_DN8649_c0_g1~~TRINITY_DN8649_c0_g1_i1.p1  ORF type:complete len:1257 (-),score=381.43 TRINITY_DN8649_c0_g1_i1:14-3784(-)